MSESPKGLGIAGKQTGQASQAVTARIGHDAVSGLIEEVDTVSAAVYH